VRFTFTDERTGCTDTFHFPDGLSAFVKYLNTGEETLHESIRISGKEAGIGVEVAFQCQRSHVEIERGYANGNWAKYGGTHIVGPSTAGRTSQAFAVASARPSGRSPRPTVVGRLT